MKHQYFGDVNDYIKYGLLRCLSQASLHIGVCWMLTPDDQRSDGHKTQYLTQPDGWMAHDPYLFKHLSQTIRLPDGRNLRHIEGRHHIKHAKFFGDIVPDSHSGRADWAKNMLASLKGCDLVFFDPDNGIEVPSKAIGYKDSSKYIYWSELAEAWKQSKALLVFQHFPRVKRDRYIPARVAEMQARLPDSSVIPLQSSNVLFLLAYRATHANQIDQAIHLIEKQWSRRVWKHRDTKLHG